VGKDRAERTHRTSFAPETTYSKRDERDQIRTKHRKINETDLFPPAHNGLVAGSSPAGPTTLMIRQRSQASVVVHQSNVFACFVGVF